MVHDVFISHSSKDKTVADATCAWLENRGIRCWVAPLDIRPGANWGSSIVKAIRGARVMILIFSQHANASPQIKREVERAVNAGVTVIPMRVEDVLPEDDLEYFLGTPHWLDAFAPPLEQHLDALANAVKEILEMPVAASRAEVPGIVQEAETEPEPVPRSTSETPAPKNLPSKPSGNGWLIGLGIAVVVLALGGLGYYYGITVPAEQARQAEIARQEAIQKEKEAEAQAAASAAEKARLDAEAQKAAAAAEALRTQQEKQQQEAEAEKEKQAQAAAVAAAQAEHLANARGGLMVRTEPEGATVTLGGEDAQTSPATFKSIKLGSYPIHITIDGYEPVDQTAEIKENQFTDLGTINLIHSTGSLSLTTVPVGADYVLSGPQGAVTQGKSPANLKDLPTGNYTVSYKRGDWEGKDTIEIKRNETTSDKGILKELPKIETADTEQARSPKPPTVEQKESGKFAGTWVIKNPSWGASYETVVINSQETSVNKCPAQISGNTLTWHEDLGGKWTIVPDDDGKTAVVTNYLLLGHDSEIYQRQ